MSGILDAIGRLFRGVVFWLIVEPWEQALRVRLGKHVKSLDPGFHFRIPILDVIYKQSVRWRTAMLHTQTLSTSDGHTLITGGTLGYIITDVRKLYETLHHAEDTIVQVTAGAIASAVFSTKRQDISAARLNDEVTKELAGTLDKYGIGEIQVRITDFAFVKTFRLVQDQRWTVGGSLRTEGKNAEDGV